MSNFSLLSDLSYAHFISYIEFSSYFRSDSQIFQARGLFIEDYYYQQEPYEMITSALFRYMSFCCCCKDLPSTVKTLVLLLFQAHS